MYRLQIAQIFNRLGLSVGNSTYDIKPRRQELASLLVHRHKKRYTFDKETRDVLQEALAYGRNLTTELVHKFSIS